MKRVNDVQYQKKFCPAVMCPDNFVQDPETCQCRPVAKTVSTALAEDLMRFKGMLDEICNTVPQILKDGLCPNQVPPYNRRNMR